MSILCRYNDNSLSHHTKAERVKHKGRNESEYQIDADSAQGI